MAIQVKHRRGTDAEINAGTPAIGELWFNTTDNSIHMGDGATVGGIKHVNINTLGNYTNRAYDDVTEMIAIAGSLASVGDRLTTGDNQTYIVSSTPDSQNLQLTGTSLYANLVKGDKVFGETFGGLIYNSSTEVELGKIYLNVIKTDDNYGSYIYFDAPEMPVSPIDYASSYGGTVKNGVFAFTGRDAVDKKTLFGYRAGFDSTSTFCTYIGQQAGEGTVDIKDATATGGSVGIGLIALFNALSRSTVAIGLESGNQGNSDNSVFSGTYSGGAAVGDKLVGLGYQACYQATTIESVAIGYQSLVSATGDKCNAVGAFSQNSSSGPETCSFGHRSLSANAGSFNAAYGNWSGFVTGGMTANNGAFFGYEAGRESNVDGVVGVGRSAGENNTGSFASFLGYLTGQNNTFARVTLLGQGAVATGADQLQLGDSATTAYAFGPVQDRSDIRDKLDIQSLTDAYIAFFMDIEWRRYRMNYRDAYYDVVEVKDNDGNVKLERVPVENDGSRAGTRYHIGAVAQQVEVAMKKHGIDFAGLQHHAVNGGKDVYTIGYQEFIGIQGEIIQRQQRRLDSIEERLNAAGL